MRKMRSQDLSSPPTERKTRGDGWQNTFTGFGTTRDKTQGSKFIGDFLVSDTELSAMFHGDDVAARMVLTGPTEMFRRGYELSVGDSAEDAEPLRDKAETLGLDNQTLEGLIWGGLYGGAVMIVGADDGLDPVKPLNEKGIRSVRYLNVIDRRFIYPLKYYDDPFQPNFGKPQIYQLTNPIGRTTSAQVHESRLIRFDGAITDLLKRRQLAGWTMSVLQRPYQVIRDFTSTYQSVANLVSDASQGVFKIQGLLDMVASNEMQNVATRMAMVDMLRSSARAVVLDADAESFERTTTTFTGLPDVIDRFMMRLSAASDPQIPVTILMGRSPAGMNATGDADFRAFYDALASRQEKVLRPILQRLYRILALAKDSGVSADDVDISFRPLWEPTDTEQATIEKTIGDRDVAYITAGVLTAEEVAKSRFGKGEWSMHTEIDVEARDRAMAAELDLMVQTKEAKAEAGPQMPPQQPPPGEPEAPEDPTPAKPPSGP